MNIQKIASRDNARVKLVRKVRDGREKSLVFIEGLRIAEECLRSDLNITQVFIVADLIAKDRGRQLVNTFLSRGFNVIELSPSIFDSIAETKDSQGIVVLADRMSTDLPSFERSIKETADNPKLFIYLHEINNPSNLGAVLRTAEAAGASGVTISERSADVFAPKAIRTSMGSVFRIPLWTNVKANEALEWAGNRRLIISGANIGAAKAYTEVDWRLPRLLIFGSEAHGIPDDIRGAIAENISIPMENGVESLNLAVSAGILLFEAKRSRKS